MNKICTKRGFSLAEALITLLIVCLITLASIPILTKKKRIANNGTHGTWMCTYNSERKLVHWTSTDPHGKPEDPDTWNEGCDNFVPPMNALAFNITAVGAGGNGGKASTKLVNVANTDNGNIEQFRPEHSGTYRVAVIGGGGGGGQGRHRYSHYRCDVGSCGTGGAGASGAWIIADVDLIGGTPYGLRRGLGGEQMNCTHNNCTKPDNLSGKTGGTSVFFLGNPNYRDDFKIYAMGGEGGERIATSGSGCCLDHCRYGNGGQVSSCVHVLGASNSFGNRSGISYEKCGGILNSMVKTSAAVNGLQYNANIDVIASSKGEQGERGGCGVTYYSNGVLRHSRGGQGFMGEKFGVSVSSNGAGGYGSAPMLGCDGDHCCAVAGNGTNGGVYIFDIQRMQGEGGKAAMPKESFSMSVKGKVKVQIGNSYSRDAAAVQTDGMLDSQKYRDLRTTVVKIYDKQDRVTKTITAFPGEDGKTFVGSRPQQGEHSFLTENGGGESAIDRCDDNGYEDVYENQGQKIKKPVCKNVKCEIVVDETTNYGEYQKGDNPNAYKTVVEKLNTISISSLDYLDKITSYINQISKDYFLEFHSTTSNGMKVVNYEKFKNNKDSYFADNDDGLSGYYNYEEARGSDYPKLKDSSERCFSDGTLKYAKQCADGVNPATGEGYYVEEYPEVAAKIGTRKSYKCYPGGNATRRAFGAGGGGGYAFTKPGFASDGGVGAPGAVIIEW